MNDIMTEASNLDREWNETNTPNITFKKSRFINDYRVIADFSNTYVSTFKANEVLKLEKESLGRQVEKRNQTIEEERKIVEKLNSDIKKLEHSEKDKTEQLRQKDHDIEELETQKKDLKLEVRVLEYQIDMLDKEVRKGKNIKKSLESLQKEIEIQGQELASKSWQIKNLESYRKSSIKICESSFPDWWSFVSLWEKHLGTVSFICLDYLLKKAQGDNKTVQVLARGKAKGVKKKTSEFGESLGNVLVNIFEKGDRFTCYTHELKNRVDFRNYLIDGNVLDSFTVLNGNMASSRLMINFHEKEFSICSSKNNSGYKNILYNQKVEQIRNNYFETFSENKKGKLHAFEILV